MLRPLAQSRADQRRFVNRVAETRELIRAVGSGQPALVLGAAGSGRTTLLNHVAWRLASGDEPVESVLVPGELAQDPAQLLGVLVARVQRVVVPGTAPSRWLDDLRALTMPDGPFGQVVQPAILMELVDLLGERLAAGGPMCLMVDGIAPAVAHGVFGGLRNELWGLDGARWVVAGDLGAEPLYREPPADAFFERVVRLAPLSDAEAAELLRAHEPGLSDHQLQEAVAVGRGNPQRLLRAAADLQAGRAPAVSAIDALADQAAGLAGPLAGALVQYIAAHGPVSASDPRLLSQLGVSRARISQLLRQLESAGLLETLEEQPELGRRGRPTRRFALKPAP